MNRSEPGRLGAMRRSREYFSPETRMELKLSPMDIVLCGHDLEWRAIHFNSKRQAGTWAANA